MWRYRKIALNEGRGGFHKGHFQDRGGIPYANQRYICHKGAFFLLRLRKWDLTE